MDKPKRSYVKGKIGEVKDNTEEIILSVALRHSEIKNRKEKLKRYGVSNLYRIRFGELGKRRNTGKQFKEITIKNFSITHKSLKLLDLRYTSTAKHSK